MIYIFDIDGTISDATHRLHYLQTHPIDWTSFFKAAAADSPVYPMIAIAQALDKQHHRISVITGRSDEIREITERWMNLFRMPFNDLLMRKEGDHRPDTVVKSELLDRLLKPRAAAGDPSHVSVVRGAFEDRRSVVDMWRARGVRALQVAEGDF